jgi:predicted TIM-barrel fold metal-dependent hydrolase
MARAAIISVDGHVKAPRAAYREYLEPAFRDTFDDWLRELEGTPDGFVHAAIGEDGQWDAARRVADLETQGVVAEVVYGNGQAFDGDRGNHPGDPAVIRASNMAYNRWLVDFCSKAPGRIGGQAAVSFNDVDQAVADIHWAADNGLVGIMMPALQPGGTFFFDPVLDPIWAACQETGLPIGQHGGTGAPDYHPQSFASFMVLATEHSFFSGRSLWQLVLGGVFERFPDLKVVWAETEDWWIRPVMELMDGRETQGDDWSEFAETLARLKPYTRLPSDYFRTNCYVGLSPFNSNYPSVGDLGTAGQVPEGFAVRSTNAMIGADYPHPETAFPGLLHEVKAFVEHPNVSEDDARRVLYGNAAEVYQLDLDALRPHIDRVGFDLDDIPVPEGVAGLDMTVLADLAARNEAEAH